VTVIASLFGYRGIRVVVCDGDRDLRVVLCDGYRGIRVTVCDDRLVDAVALGCARSLLLLLELALLAQGLLAGTLDR
jgi:hypothetical protein